MADRDSESLNRTPWNVAHVTAGRTPAGVEHTKCGLVITMAEFPAQQVAAKAGHWCKECQELDG